MFNLRRIRVSRRSAGSYEARTEGDRIFLNDKFFALPRDTWKHMLLHELGHWFRAAYVPLDDILGWGPGDKFFDLFSAGNSEEGFAEAFAVHLLEPSELRARYPEQAKQMKKILGGHEAQMRRWADGVLVGLGPGAGGGGKRRHARPSRLASLVADINRLVRGG